MFDNLGPAEKQNIQQVDQQIDDLIQEMNAGKRNVGRLFYIGQQLSLLSQNQYIPQNVKNKLELALQSLQSEPYENIKIDKIISLKKEIGNALDNPNENDLVD